jgi:hypothetical protein
VRAFESDDPVAPPEAARSAAQRVVESPTNPAALDALRAALATPRAATFAANSSAPIATAAPLAGRLGAGDLRMAPARDIAEALQAAGAAGSHNLPRLVAAFKEVPQSRDDDLAAAVALLTVIASAHLAPPVDMPQPMLRHMYVA